MYTVPPHTTKTETPTYNDDALVEDLTFYCAETKSDLEKTCHLAIECTDGNTCPEGQGCIHFVCEQSTNSPSRESSAQDFNHFVPQCPVDFSGVTSNNEVNCKLYYECNNGELGDSHLCGDGLKYDLIRDMCWYESEVDSDCRGPPMESPEPSLHPTPRPTYDTSNLFCLDNYVGSTSSGDTDCRLYYECKNGVVGAVDTCGDEFKYDIIRQMCWYSEEVNEHCYGPPLDGSTPDDVEQIQDSTTQASEIANNETIIYECLDGYTGWASILGCKQYYWCKNGTMERDILECVGDLLFDEIDGTCKQPSDVQCDQTLDMKQNESTASSYADNKYLWPDTNDSSAMAEDRGPDMGEWYSRTQVFLDSPGVRMNPCYAVGYYVIILFSTQLILYL